ncbi:MAG: hypothetical protein CMH32_04040 [Micavibrio sp.]|nr:hypothetical protein [Micavibrio sp.]|tara:strand:+ start:1369 stop:2262 length:894 start_codon:yes stop_codon:yes gene_type:complete
MIVITQDTEKILAKDLKKTYVNSPEDYCFSISFSRLSIQKEEWLGAMSDISLNLQSMKTMKVYICYDNDVFILANNMPPKTFQIFVKELAKKISFPSLENFCADHLLASSWKKLDNICAYKQESLYRYNVIKGNGIEADESEPLTEESYDIDLLSNLNDRRRRHKYPHVFVVDDDAMSRSLIRVSLQGEHKIEFCSDGTQALSGYVKYAPDVLFLDIGLPYKNGHELIQEILSIDPKAYIIMFSGLKDKSNVLKAIDNGAKGYITKPFSRDHLLRYISKSPFVLERDPNYSAKKQSL